LPAKAAATLAAHEGRGAVPDLTPPVVPFGEAVTPIIEPGPKYKGVKLLAEQQELKQEGLEANGYLAGTWVRISTEKAGAEAAGKKGGETTEEFPENMVARVKQGDQSGHEIHNMTGFNWRLAYLFGGYMAQPNLRSTSLGASSTLTKPAFYLYIPNALARTGFGSLSNLTATTLYQIQIVVETLAKVYKEAEFVTPEFEISTWTELFPLPQAMTGPEPEYPEGRPQEQKPPMEGTIQAWTEEAGLKISTGEQNFKFGRVGNLVRLRIIRTFTTASVPSETILPTNVQYIWARISMNQLPAQLLTDWAISKVWGLKSSDLPKGVYPLLYNEGMDRFTSGQNPGSYQPTVNATRQELKGEFKEGLGTIITNDLSVGAVTPIGRREVPGQTSEKTPLGAE
jgi:hypothetical protein